MGWHRLLATDAVGTGEVHGAEAAGIELVVWRDRAGRPVVMDARCPHQLSSLVVDGLVDAGEILCLAHGWRFDPQGCGSKLNMAGRRDEKAGIDTYESRDHGGFVEARLDRPTHPD